VTALRYHFSGVAGAGMGPLACLMRARGHAVQGSDRAFDLGKKQEIAEPLRRLGIALAPPYVARRMRRAVGLPERDGLLVRGVRDGSPADRAGVRRGDLIVAVNGSETDRLDTLHAAVDSGAPTLELGLVRGAEELTVTVAFDADVQTV